MYKKVIVTKNINDDASVLNDTIREKIKDFMVLNGWTLDTSKSHGCNYCLYKDFSSQNNSPSLNNSRSQSSSRTYWASKYNCKTRCRHQKLLLP